ncbi:MAG: GcrA family cell cycle regulator [Pseudomonadota bacterium]
MAWTEDRVETLKKLWADGLSASQIAKQLGGVTRNAVIGKVHRLGLSGRAAPSRPTRRPAAPRTASPRPAAKAAAKPKPAPASAPATPAAARAPAPVRQVAPAAPIKPAMLPSGEYATVLTLREGMCKWPIGDPADTEFRFCGRGTKPGSAYCDAHAQLAYQPQAKRKRKPADDARAALDSLQATRRVNF